MLTELYKLYTKITNMIKRATITNVDTSTKMYTLQTKSYNTVKNATMLMPYGLFCNPIVNSEGLTFSLGGDGSRMYCVPFNPELIPTGLASGDVALFSSKTTTIILKKDGNININTTKDVNVNCTNLVANVTTKAEVTAPTIDLIGNVNITGNLTVSGTSILTGTTTIETKPFITHVHTAGTPPGNTGGVQ